jgi:uncharacterized protein involved in exopolysaccharide biosynthesis
LEEELAGLRLRYGEDHPEIKRKKAELAALPPETDVDRVERSNEPPAGASEPAPAVSQAPQPTGLLQAVLAAKERISDLKVQLGLAAKEVDTADANRVRILREVTVSQERINRIPLREQEIATLARDYETAKTNYKSLLDKKLSAEMAKDMELSMQGEKFTLIDAAQVPRTPFKPNRRLLFVLGVVLSLAISALVVLAWGVRRDTFLGEWELTPGVVVLGRVPRIEKATGRIVAMAGRGGTA